MSRFTNVLFNRDHSEYARYCTGWNKRIVHRPDFVAAASDGQHVEDAVRFAVERNLPIRVQSTGHGALAAYEGGLLIDTSAIGGIEINPERRIATLGAGIRWQQLLDAAQPFGLAGLAGSSGGVGVVGYALGGGAGWLARRHGLCSDMIEAAEITTADGVRRWVDAESDSDLLWGAAWCWFELRDRLCFATSPRGQPDRKCWSTLLANAECKSDSCCLSNLGRNRPA